MKHRSHTAAGLIKSTTSVSIFTPLNTTTLLQKQTLLSQKHRLYRRRILPYQKYHLLRHRSHPSWNRYQFRRIHLSNHPCQHRLYLKFRLSSHPKYPWTRSNPLSYALIRRTASPSGSENRVISSRGRLFRIPNSLPRALSVSLNFAFIFLVVGAAP